MTSYLLHSISFLVAISASAVISIYSVRKIIFITRNRKIYDIPDDTRKFHGPEIPSLGGIGIFIGYILVALFFWPKNHAFMPYVVCSTVVLFFTGIYDDLMNMRPSKKLVAQLLASFITVYFADVRLESLYGLLGITDIPYAAGVALATIGCTFFINAFNFIDGIDGLACMLASLYVGLLACMFAIIRHDNLAGISFALLGATLGLLVYNRAPAKIYMGDTGSMMLGFTIFTFSVLFIKMFAADGSKVPGIIRSAQSAIVIVFSILFLPIFDALRVFIVRLSQGRSPLRADRSHLHYYLLDAGFTHSQSVFIILAVNTLIIFVAYRLQNFDPAYTLVSITALASLTLTVVYGLRQRKLEKGLL